MSNKLKKQPKPGITITIAELLAAQPAFIHVLQGLALPFAASYDVKVLLEKIAPEYAAAKNTEIEIYRKNHAIEKDGQLTVLPENTAALMADLAPFLNKHVTLNVPKLPWVAFAEAKGSVLGQYSIAIMPFLDRKEDQ